MLHALQSLLHPSLGNRGERLAGRWLKRRGYRILSRNLRQGHDEIDLLALAPDRHTVVVVEVKTRRDSAIHPTINITPTKMHRLTRSAARLLRQPAFAGKAIRFDVIAITWPMRGKPTVEHYPHAFESTL
jgi:putative endonuclease